MKLRRAILVVAACIAALALAAGLYVRRFDKPHPTYLSAIATQIPHCENLSGLFWLSQRELLVLRGNPPCNAFRKDVVTGAETPLPGLSRLLHDAPPGSNGGRGMGPGDLCAAVSPDGSRLLWAQGTRAGTGASWPTVTRIFAARLDGSEYRRWPLSRPAANPCWLPGNAPSIACFQAGARRRRASVVLVFDAANGSFRTVPTDFNFRNISTVASDPNRINFGGFEVAWADARGGATFLGLALNVGSKLAAGHMLRVIIRSTPLSMPAPSPGLDRLAWILTTTSRTPTAEAIRSLLPRFPVHEQTDGGLWISRLDGSDMRCIGIVPDTGNRPAANPAWLMWTPDGRHLVYGCQDRVYVVPAD
jgi:hypothetical protein